MAERLIYRTEFTWHRNYRVVLMWLIPLENSGHCRPCSSLDFEVQRITLLHSIYNSSFFYCARFTGTISQLSARQTQDLWWLRWCKTTPCTSFFLLPAQGIAWIKPARAAPSGDRCSDSGSSFLQMDEVKTQIQLLLIFFSFLPPPQPLTGCSTVMVLWMVSQACIRPLQCSLGRLHDTLPVNFLIDFWWFRVLFLVNLVLQLRNTSWRN